MKNLIPLLFVYLSFGMSSISNGKVANNSSFEMSIPNKTEMEREVRKISATVIKAHELNKEVSSTLQELDSLNNALNDPKELRKFKQELKSE